MEHYRWITYSEANIHHFAEAMGRLKETGYVPPFGWDWGNWSDELRESTYSHFLYKILLNETRRITQTVAGGKSKVTNLKKEEIAFIKETSSQMTEKVGQALKDYGNMQTNGMMVVRKRKVNPL